MQELHTYGLLRGAFRPAEAVCVLRSSVRQRSLLIEEASQTMQHMQKALEHMNLKLTEVVSDITGHTGMGIIRAILALYQQSCHEAQSICNALIDGARDISPMQGSHGNL